MIKKIIKTSQFIYFIAVIFSIATFSSIWASPSKAEGDDSESAYTLGTIVVIGHKEEGAKGIAIDPTATSIVTDDYSSPKSAQTVQDILHSIAGIDVQGNEPMVTAGKNIVKIRGLNAREIQVRIDGRPFRNSGGLGDQLIPWSALTLDDVERIEVVRGAHSAVYGETVGGTINIVTKKGGTRKDAKPEMKVMADYSSFDTQYYKASIAGNVNRLGYSVGGGFRSSDGFLRDSDYETKDFTARLSYLFPFDGRLTLGYKGNSMKNNLYSVNDPDNSLVGDLYDPSYPVLKADCGAWSSPSYPGSDSFYDKDIQHFDLFFEQSTAIGDWTLNVYKSKEYHNQQSYYYSSAYGFYDYPWDVTWYDWGWIVRDTFSLFDKHRITFGADSRTSHYRYDAVSPSRVWHVPKSKRFVYLAGYVEDSYQVTDKLNLTLGLRYDQADINIVSGVPAYPSSEKDESELSPKSSLTYEFLPGSKAFLNISKAYRPPLGLEISSCGAPVGIYLDTETAMEYEGGLIQDLGKDNSLRLAYYYYDIDNYIVHNRNQIALLNAGRIDEMVTNADYLRLQGAEAELNFHLFESLGGYLNFTYQKSELGNIRRISEEDIYCDHYQSPKFKVNMGLDLTLPKDITLLTNVRFVDDRKTNKNQEMDSFITMDFAIEKRLVNQNLKLKAYVTNLFDEYYEEVYHMPSQERTFGINVNYVF